MIDDYYLHSGRESVARGFHLPRRQSSFGTNAVRCTKHASNDNFFYFCVSRYSSSPRFSNRYNVRPSAVRARYFNIVFARNSFFPLNVRNCTTDTILRFAGRFTKRKRLDVDTILLDARTPRCTEKYGNERRCAFCPHRAAAAAANYRLSRVKSRVISVCLYVVRLLLLLFRSRVTSANSCFVPRLQTFTFQSDSIGTYVIPCVDASKKLRLLRPPSPYCREYRISLFLISFDLYCRAVGKNVTHKYG